MTRGDIRTDLRFLIGSPTTADVPDSLLNDHINKAYRWIGVRYGFLKVRKVTQALITAIGVQNYTLPTDCFAVRGVTDVTNNMKLVKKGERWMQQQMYANATTAKPMYYVRLLDYLMLWPIPDGVYTLQVYYNSTIADLASDSDTPLLPVPWHEGISIRSKYVYHLYKTNDAAKKQDALTDWNEWVSEMPTEVDLENVDIDSGVEIPTLSSINSLRYDFDHGA